ncbi:MAG: hypothetical protein IPK13_11790 [Deltaproteobacteria bacterium]|nr:hypothetical protein [Deltaproteobacteria bacterium]
MKTQEETKHDQPIILAVNINGVDLPAQMFENNGNEDRTAQVAETLDEFEAAETPDFIISTATSRF